MKLQRQHSERDDRRLGPTRVGSPEPRVRAEQPMKCVWSGYPDYNRDCRSRIPASVVVKAWHREIQLKGTVEGFFYFSWRSGVWLAYGLEDGGVRGVYCPTHCVDRDTRGSQGAEPRAETSADTPVQGVTGQAAPDAPATADHGAVVKVQVDAGRATRLGVALR
jgi:hypothetical protein